MDFESFCKRLQHKFPEIKGNPAWHNWEWSNESCEQSAVFSEVAREMIRWAETGKWQAVKSILSEVEDGFTKGSHTVRSFLGTDFTVTIMECNNPTVRDRIKELMGKETKAAYQINLRGYNEA